MADHNVKLDPNQTLGVMSEVEIVPIPLQPATPPKNPIIPGAEPQSYTNPQIRSLSNQKMRVKHVTGGASPVKQAMRRTPLGFEAEERSHLEKLLDSGVILPSNSEWAPALVLVRKKHGSFRWCIDY